MTDGLSLSELMACGVPGELRGDDSVRVTGVRHDSRTVEPGDLFAAIAGGTVDGAGFAADAVRRGATAVISAEPLSVAVPQLITTSPRRAMGIAAEHVYGEPTGALSVVGITGTNGKTTTAWLLEAALAGAKARPALMGTVASRGPGIERAAPLTTPEGDDVARFAAEVRRAGASHLVMEVSSHALALHRVDGVRFDVAAFTNLTQDHLDFHGDLESYGNAKARLFRELGPRVAVVNVDDAFGVKLGDELGDRCVRCSTHAETTAEVRVVSSHVHRHGISARIAMPEGEVPVESPLVGGHNLENLTVALGCMAALGLDPFLAASALNSATGAPGRLERIAHPGDVSVFVDYAHTPDALARVLSALRPFTPGRLWVVFGCGGDRDRTKRPLMGEAAGRAADISIVTSDNPRTEDAESIVRDVVEGVERSGAVPVLSDLDGATAGYVPVVDRRDAIRLAVAHARAGDTLLVAGRGHETHQIVGRERRPFLDRDVTEELIAEVAAGRREGEGRP